MKCPYCGCEDSKVIDSRPTDEGERIRRRRECTKCGKRFTTYEIIETVPLIVVKKDGTRESFDRVKLFNGLLHRKSCHRHRVAVAELSGKRDHFGQNRRTRHGKTQGHRRSRLCPVRLGLSPVQRRQHLRRRSHETAQRKVNRQNRTKNGLRDTPEGRFFFVLFPDVPLSDELSAKCALRVQEVCRIRVLDDPAGVHQQDFR